MAEISAEVYERYQAGWARTQSSRLTQAESKLATVKQSNAQLRLEIKDRDKLIDALCKSIRLHNGTEVEP